MKMVFVYAVFKLNNINIVNLLIFLYNFVYSLIFSK